MRIRSTDRRQGVVVLIILAQVGWLSALMSRGWYYQDDLAFLAQASGRGLGLTYLNERVNDHLTPGLRFAFWLLRPLGASAYGVTIAARAVLQAAATWLLYGLLVRLVGAGRVTLIVLAGYALSPLLIGELWLSCAVNVLPAQVLVLLGMHCAVSFVHSGRLRYAAGMGFSFLTAVTFWELSGVDFVLLVPLALGYLYDGTFAQRLAKMRSQWVGWSFPTLMLVGFAIVYLLGGRGNTARLVNAGKLLHVWWQEWADTVAPMALGGPWKWIAAPTVYVSASKPPTAAIWIAQAVVVAAVAWSVLRTGRRVLVAWSLPVIFVVIASTIVAIGRFNQFGLLSAHTVTYAFDAAVPVALAAALAFGHPPTAAARPIARRLPRRSGLAIGVLVLALVGALFSDVRFTNRWAQNPTRRYLATLRSDLDARPAANIFDTPVPARVLPYIEPHHYLSDVVGLIDQHPAFNAGRSDPQIVDGQGHIVPARFYPAARVDPPQHESFCNNLVTGMTTRTKTLSSSPAANEWFVRLDYFQQHPSVVHVTLVDRLGKVTAAVSGSRVVLGSDLGSTYLRFPRSAPVALRISSDSLSTNVCFTAAIVGYPFVSGAK